MIRIETQRLILRRMQDSDLQVYHGYDNHPGHCQFLSRAPYTEQQAREFIAVAHSLPIGAEGKYLHVSVDLKATGEMIGDVCIKVANKTHRQGEVGWFMSSAYQGQGLATEASRAILEFGFTTLDLHRITALCDANNSNSRRMMERLGMRREAHYKNIAFFDDEWHDQYCYAIVKPEWESQASCQV